MSVYVFSQAIGHTTDSINYMRIYKEQMLGETSASITHGSDSPQLAAFYKNAERSEVQANTPQLAAGKFIQIYIPRDTGAKVD